MKLEIIEQQPHWLIINKPAGVSVHNDPQDVCHLLKAQLDPKSYQDIHLVHRLDKETSGLLLIALNSKKAAELATKFQDRNCKKKYFAVIRGGLPTSDSWQRWTLPLTDKAEGRKNPQGFARDRQESITEYKVIKSNKFLSLLEVNLLTGRQHQIRKHCAIAKHAIVGDSRYGDPKYNEKMSSIYKTKRMYLHAGQLNINIDGTDYEFTAPPPTEFQQPFQEIS